MNKIKQLVKSFFEIKLTATDESLISKQIDYLKYWLGVLGYCIFVYIFFGFSLFSGEMFAEAAVIYFKNSSGSISQLLVTDGGYLVWPQQLIAWVAYDLEIPSKWIPYFYNATATLLSGMMVFTFSLPRFRCLISSDFMRIALCVTISLVGGYDNRQFINFTYYSSFFLATTIGMLVVSKPSKIPWYTFSFPILFLGKPAILAIFPMVVISLFFVKNNFRIIVLLCTVAVIGQLINSYFTFMGKKDLDYPFLERLAVYLSHLSVQIISIVLILLPKVLPNILQYILALISFSYFIFICLTWKHPVKILIIFGIILIGGASFIVSFGLKGDQFIHWKIISNHIAIFRWTLLQIFGILMIAMALAHYIAEKIDQPKKWFGRVEVIFVIWFLLSLWSLHRMKSVFPPATQWKNVAWQSNHNEGVFEKVCTSIQPLGWVYGKDGACIPIGTHISINPTKMKVERNFQVTLHKPIEIKKKMVQSIVVVYHIEKNSPSHTIKLQVNDLVLTKQIQMSSNSAKNMVVQFNLPFLMNGDTISNVYFLSDIPIYIDSDDSLQPNTHAHWYTKKL